LRDWDLDDDIGRVCARDLGVGMAGGVVTI
jgi:hypothetical protein